MIPFNRPVSLVNPGYYLKPSEVLNFPERQHLLPIFNFSKIPFGILENKYIFALPKQFFKINFHTTSRVHTLTPPPKPTH